MDIEAVTKALNAIAEDVGANGDRWWGIKHALPPTEKAFVEAVQNLIDRSIEAAGR